MLDSFLGLPAHPLIVHAPVVLVPLASLGLLVLLLRPAWRPRYAGLLLVGLVAAALGAIAAAVSGNAFAERVGLPVSHQSYGTALAAVSVALAVAGGSWLWLVRREREASPRLTTLGWTAGAVSLIAIVLVGLTGHSGATAAWASATPSSSGTGSPSFTLGDVAGHATQDSCWAAVDDGVYDLTGWIDRHPGGQARILALCGTDATAAFQDQHDSDDRPQEQLAQFRIGDLLG
ncbi:cytochrome b5-like heme/steroid binding domain-containing protein [Tessaracoccus defluvii]|uniref:Cytochrome b5 domain-containing protein n=1 Tax=Tessaracoccus defluvii TaxID=1285901 RepID=A0A7H0H5G6_9ACTN|nr:cytochrome b5-like heme/steroid binding domain-containing protein [Tessaracoccus defluvii]QNP55782.1 cytochrome b5 domain-containing protein [Tessaracoccus defluvii]